MRPAIIDTAAGDGALSVDYDAVDAVCRVRDLHLGGVRRRRHRDVAEADDDERDAERDDVDVTYRTGATPVPDGTWTSFTALGTGGLMTGSSRYVQFAIQMTTTAAAKTPVISAVTVQWK